MFSDNEAALGLLRLLRAEAVVHDGCCDGCKGPCVRESGETDLYELNIDTVKVGEGGELAAILALLGAAMSVFNLKTRMTVRSLTWFLFTQVMGLPAEAKPDPAAVEAIKGL